jgi:hypothetical protein
VAAEEANRRGDVGVDHVSVMHELAYKRKERKTLGIEKGGEELGRRRL